MHTDVGDDVWVFDGTTIPNIGLNAVAGRPPEEYGVNPTSFEEMRPGCFDIHERVKDMSAGGVLASMCFPSFPAFSGRLFAGTDDKDLALAAARAYNDWHIDEWAGTYPGRIIPMALPVLWDPELCADEIHRVAAKGCHSITFTENPAALGYPSFHDEHWDPMWRGAGRRRAASSTSTSARRAARGHRARRADGRDDHAAADEHLHGGRRPRVVARLQEVPRR